MGNKKDGLDRAIEYAGGVQALADLLDVSIQSVTNWRTRGVPIARCPDIEEATGVRCESLRPDCNWSVLRKGGRA